MKSLAAQAIILRRIDYGEADRIITFLTSEFGKIRAIAKGVRRQKSKMAGGLELFSESEIHFINGKGDIDTLVSTRLRAHHGSIVKDLEKTELAYSMLKTIDRIVEDRTGVEYYEVLRESLAALEDPGVSDMLAECSFLARTLQAGGHIPDFTTDSSGTKLGQDKVYSYDFEAVCFYEDAQGQFNKNHLKVLKLLAHNNPANLKAIEQIGQYTSEVRGLLRSLQGYFMPS